jgi:uroporphyrinogen decarboxylase
MKQEKDFNKFLKLLNGQLTGETILTEFFIHDIHCRDFAPKYKNAKEYTPSYYRMIIEAWNNMGYHYCLIGPWQFKGFTFPKGDIEEEESRSQFDQRLIYDQESFDNYVWPDPNNFDYDVFDKHVKDLPDGMKFMSCSDGGVLENAIHLVGYEKLCYMYFLEPDLTKQIFDEIGGRLLKYFKYIASVKSIGAVLVNDDWGFKSQTMFPPDMMAEYVFPWHKKIVEAIHNEGKPAILHSCGNLAQIMDVIIDELKYDAKHSFEDNIIPVEEAIELWGDRICIAGGIDLDFLFNQKPQAIKQRAEKLIEQTKNKSNFGLGSGNSIPKYIPSESFHALLSSLNRNNK